MSWKSILKSYDLDEFIIQKKGVPKEKAAKEVEVQLAPGITGTLVITPRMDEIIQDMERWHQTCSTLSKDAIGIKGEKNRPSLLEHCLSHWEEAVKRPKQETKHGAMELIEKVMKIIREEEAYTKQDLKLVDDMVIELKEIENHSRTNPKNIIFTEEIGPDKKRPVRGHYRTDWYERKTGDKAVPKEWYDYNVSFARDDDSSTAEPPFWQALFAGGENPPGKISGLTKGLLTLLIELAEEIPKQPITDIRVWGKQGREKISKLADFMKVFRNILKDQDNYHSVNQPFKRLYINNAKLRRVLALTPFQIPKSKLKQEQFKKTFGLEKYVTTNLVDWKVVRITPGLIRSIIVNSRINTNTFPHGSYKGIFLTTPSATRAKTDQKQLWEREYLKAKREKNLPRWAYKEEDEKGEENPNVKKSWMSILKAPILERRPMPVAPGNPASKLHMPRIFNKERQSEVSKDKDETCDYCERDVVLDCRDCGQKLCNRHLSKPCVRVRKSDILKRRKNQEALNRGSEVKEYDSNPRRGTKVSGGEITVQDIRRAIQDIKKPDPEDEPQEMSHLLIVLPYIEKDVEERTLTQGIKTGIFTYGVAKEMFGENLLRDYITNSEGMMGAHWMNESELSLFPGAEINSFEAIT
jgi:hypothetical protein